MERLKFKVSLGKSYKDSISKTKLTVAEHTCNHSYTGGEDRRIVVQGWHQAKRCEGLEVWLKW
jgi:hypothetical protein